MHMDGYGHSHFINIVCKKIVMWEAPCLNDQVAALVGTNVTHSQKKSVPTHTAHMNEN